MPARDFRTRLTRRAAKGGVFLSDDLSERLTAYYELLARWNRKINLTALENPDEAIDRLLMEPLLAVRHVQGHDLKLLDVGSGGGSPAIPMKLAMPGFALTMVEVKARKSAFLREAIRTLELDRTQVETSRYEELLTRPELHERYDLLSLRAVRVEPRTLRTLQAFVRPGGTLLLFRGPGGPDTPETLHPLSVMATLPLVEALQSRLTILVKRDDVPRGT